MLDAIEIHVLQMSIFETYLLQYLLFSQIFWEKKWTKYFGLKKTKNKKVKVVDPDKKFCNQMKKWPYNWNLAQMQKAWNKLMTSAKSCLCYVILAVYFDNMTQSVNMSYML